LLTAAAAAADAGSAPAFSDVIDDDTDDDDDVVRDDEDDVSHCSTSPSHICRIASTIRRHSYSSQLEPVMIGLGIEGHGIGLGLGTHIRPVAGDTRVFEVQQ